MTGSLVKSVIDLIFCRWQSITKVFWEALEKGQASILRLTRNICTCQLAERRGDFAATTGLAKVARLP